MQDSIYQLGKTIQSTIDSFCNNLTTKHVIGIIFKKQKNSVKYLKAQTYDFHKKSDYLYARDLSGQGPGLFLTGRIRYDDVKYLQNAIKKNNNNIDLQNKTVSNFVTKKITRLITKGKFLQKDDILDTLPEERKQEIKYFKDSFAQNHDKIAKDVIDLLIKDRPEEIFLTIMFYENGKPKFVGQIKDYVDFYKKCFFAKKKRHQAEPESLTCCTCNEEKIIDTFEQPPIPFLYLNKPMFAPGLDPAQSKKIFPLCDDCFPLVKAGWSWLEEHVKFSVGIADKKGAALRFMLIPRLNNYQLMRQFKHSMMKKRLYLNSIRTLCEKLESISLWDSGPKEVNVFLNFSTLYYNHDSNGNMRPFSLVNGVYPQRLEELLVAKEQVDKIFPFKQLSTVFQTNFMFGFPVLAKVYEDTVIKWQDRLAETISKIFTNKKVSTDEIIKIINLSVTNSGYKENDIKQIGLISFRGLQLLEYLNRLNHEDEPPNNMTGTRHLNEQTAFYEEFVKGKKLLTDKTARGSFAIGASVGILLCAQEIRHKGNTPFSKNLYRPKKLEMLMKFFPEVQQLLSQYGMHEYDIMINYLAEDISNIEPNSETSNDIIELSFSLGLSVGRLIGKGKARELL